MDESRLADDIFDLILLQSSDEMPVAVKSDRTEALYLGDHLLHPVLSEILKTGDASCFGIAYGEYFGYTDKGDIGYIPSRFPAAVSYGFPDGSKTHLNAVIYLFIVIVFHISLPYRPA